MSSSARHRARSSRAHYGRYALRTVAVVAFAGTAALAVVLTRAPEQAALTAENLACTSSGLAARIGLAADQGAVPTFTLEFINISHRTCVLKGYPSVDAYAGAQQVGSPATLDTSILPRTVTLAPGDGAHATLRYTGTGQFGRDACHQVTASRLRVYPSRRAAGGQFVPVHIPACSRRGPHFLTVAAIQPRLGALAPAKY
jgi:Protein of unknown function (DUF4232)